MSFEVTNGFSIDYFWVNETSQTSDKDNENQDGSNTVLFLSIAQFLLY